MLIEGKLAATALEIVAKKLVDIFGGRADAFFKKDEIRAASYESYYALRRMEEVLADLEREISHMEKSEEMGTLYGTLDGSSALAYHLNLLSDQLKLLKPAFASMKVKMEIYQSMEEAVQVDIFINGDDDLIQKLLYYQDVGIERMTLWQNMKTGVEAARKSISLFIKTNYKLDQKESGR